MTEYGIWRNSHSKDLLNHVCIVRSIYLKVSAQLILKLNFDEPNTTSKIKKIKDKTDQQQTSMQPKCEQKQIITKKKKEKRRDPHKGHRYLLSM